MITLVGRSSHDGLKPIADWRRPDIVLVRNPRNLGLDAEIKRRQWKPLGFRAPPDWRAAEQEHISLTDILEENGARLLQLPPYEGLTLDAIYVRDAACLTPRGIVACSMGKASRRMEPAALACALREFGIPVEGEIVYPGTLEGGDVLWLTDTLCAIGHSYRSNRRGLDQFRELVRSDADIIEVQIPHKEGPAEVLHLSSLCSVISKDACVASKQLLPAAFLETLRELGFHVLPVDRREEEQLAANVLVCGTHQVCMISGGLRTRHAIEQLGITVMPFDGSNIALAGDGGPTCLTRPLTYHDS